MRGEKTVVFDIDGALCYHTEDEIDYHRDKHRECKQFICEVTGELNVFKPYVDLLFKFLIASNIRIVFFSIGTAARNKTLTRQLLTLYFGQIQYEILRAKGQFRIFSRSHAKRTSFICNDKIHYGYLKDLRRCLLTPGESLLDFILVDDNPRVVMPCDDQRDFVSLKHFNSFDEHSLRDYSNDSLWYKNGMYYLLGLFSVCLSSQQYQDLTLRQAVRSVLNTGSTTQDNAFGEKAPPVSLQLDLIGRGLRLIRQCYSCSEAVLYGVQSVQVLRMEPRDQHTVYSLQHSADEVRAIFESVLSGERGLNETGMQVLVEEIRRKESRQRMRDSYDMTAVSIVDDNCDVIDSDDECSDVTMRSEMFFGDEEEKLGEMDEELWCATQIFEMRYR